MLKLKTVLMSIQSEGDVPFILDGTLNKKLGEFFELFQISGNCIVIQVRAEPQIGSAQSNS